jgi:hypothetical protein
MREPAQRVRWQRLASLAGAVSIGLIASQLLGAACLLELQHVRACGDLYVDPVAGEACEPGLPQSFADACAPYRDGRGQARCDEQCQIVASDRACARCGDNIIDDDDEESGGGSGTNGGTTGEGTSGGEVGFHEECDTSEIGDARCPGVPDERPGCFECRLQWEDCPPYCGDGIVDPALGEECDGGGFVVELDCGLVADSPYQGIEYGSGRTRCTNCRWDRRDCSYCGNERLEDEIMEIDSNPPPLYSLPEVCDGERFDLVALARLGECPEGSRPNFSCTDECELDVRDGEPACCLLAGTGCDPDDATRPCCSSYDGDPEPGCVVDPSGITASLCR